jgi:hypothetical protein
MELLGHSSITVTMRPRAAAMMRDAADQMDAIINAQ